MSPSCNPSLLPRSRSGLYAVDCCCCLCPVSQASTASKIETFSTGLARNYQVRSQAQFCFSPSQVLQEQAVNPGAPIVCHS